MRTITAIVFLVFLLVAGISQAFAEGETCPAETEVSVTVEVIDYFEISMSDLTGQATAQGYAACATYYEYRSYTDWWNGHCADIDEKWYVEQCCHWLWGCNYDYTLIYRDVTYQPDAECEE